MIHRPQQERNRPTVSSSSSSDCSSDALHRCREIKRVETLTTPKKGAKKVEISCSGVGLLVLDADGKAIYSNAEAVRVLGYPNRQQGKSDLGDLLGELTHTLLSHAENFPQSASCWAFVSGRRHYLCRIFSASSPTEGFPKATVVVFERGVLGSNIYSSTRSS